MAAKKKGDGQKAAAKRYEMTIVVDSQVGEDQIKSVLDRTRSILDKNGCNVINTEDVGKRKLAYEISGKQYGYYTVFQFDGPASTVAEIEADLNISEHVLRYLAVTLDKKLLAHREKSEVSAVVRPDSEKDNKK